MQPMTVIAANRFGLGARPGELADIDRDPRRWLLNQLDGPGRPAGILKRLPASSELLVEVQALKRARSGATPAGATSGGDYRTALRRLYREQSLARYRAAAASDHPVHERLVHFWSNHFAISADKQPLSAIACSFENEAIRPFVHGKFADLLIAVERHAAMILYLDNERSIGPNSKLGKRVNERPGERKFGLNENLAREVLELHTLGADGDYTLQDIGMLARVLSGWTVGGASAIGRNSRSRAGRFVFDGRIHEPGAHRVLGKTYGQKGVRQGETVLRDLAVHPSTARHVATKLARHFVADEPPAPLVDRLTRVYLRSDGELNVVYRALIESEEPWRELFTKYKTPHDLVISAYRALDRSPPDARMLVAGLETMGQAPFMPGSPAGWPDTAEQWGGADALYKRIEWLDRIAHRMARRSDVGRLGEAVLGPALSERTHEAVSHAESATQGMTLLFASADFQRR